VDRYGIKAGIYMNRLTKDIPVSRYGIKAGRYLKSGVHVILRQVSLASKMGKYTEIMVEDPEK
jgi:hypothetical protein